MKVLRFLEVNLLPLGSKFIESRRHALIHGELAKLAQGHLSAGLDRGRWSVSELGAGVGMLQEAVHASFALARKVGLSKIIPC